MANATSLTSDVLKKYEKELVAEWLAELKAAGSAGETRINEAELRTQVQDFLRLLQDSSRQGNVDDVGRPEWAPVRDFLDGISRTRALQGFTADQTAMFV